jgi:hypothetical protein
LKNNPEKVSSPFSNDSIRDWPWPVLGTTTIVIYCAPRYQPFNNPTLRLKYSILFKRMSPGSIFIIF